MTTESTPAKVRLSDRLGPADEARPLVARLRARLAGSICNADGTYTVGNCQPDALCHEAAAEIERLRAALEVSQAATEAAVSKAQWQAVTNKELNKLQDEVRKLRAAAIKRLNDEFGA